MSNWNSKFVKEGLTFDDVLSIPAESHVLSNNVDLKVELTNSLKLNLPFISAGMSTVTKHRIAIAMAQAGGLGVIRKDMTIANQANKVKLVKNTEVAPKKAAVDDEHRLLTAAAVDVTTDTFERAGALIDAGANTIVIDTAHGHSAGVLCKTSKIRAKFPNIDLITENVAAATSTRVLYDARVDTIKVGIGPGSICTTRVVVGTGVPQITATYDAANVTREYGKAIIADDGIKYSGDIIKALAVGGNAVILGSMSSGTHGTPGRVFKNQGQKFKAYRGMGSVGTVSQAHGSNGYYSQGGVNEANRLVPEGVEAYIAYKGYVKDVIFQLIGGLRVGMGYVETPDLAALIENAQLVRITNAGLAELHPRDVWITK